MRVVTGLILSGGGARAAYQVGVLQAIEQMRRERTPARGNPYGVICGTSAGALNAAVLACGADDYGEALDRLFGLWSELRTSQVYRAHLKDMVGAGLRWMGLMTLAGWLTPSPQAGSWRPRALLDHTPLAQLLEEHLDFTRLPGLLRDGHLQALAVGALSYGCGEHVTFYQSHQAIEPWCRSRRLSHRDALGIGHLLASAAIPLVFPATPLSGPHGLDYFGDGSMRQSAPLSPAIHLGANKLLVIGAGRMHEARTTGTRPGTLASEPSLAQIAGQVLSGLFQDALAGDVEQLERINRMLQTLPPALVDVTDLRPVQCLLITPSQSLDDLAARHAQHLPGTMRHLLRKLGTDHRQDQGMALLSYLLFEQPYTRALLAMGQADALARRAEIEAFFGWTVAA